IAYSLNQEVAVYPVLTETDNALFTEEVDVILAQHLGEFLVKDNVTVVIVGVEQSDITHIAAKKQRPEDRDKRGYAGATGKKNTRTFIVDGSKYVFDTYGCPGIQLPQLLGYPLMVVVDFDDKLQIVP